MEDEASLLAAARAGGKIRDLPGGFGEKTEDKIIRAIENMKSTEARRPLYKVLPIAHDFEAMLGAVEGVERVGIGGSLRRRRDTVGDIDLIASTRAGDLVMEAFSASDMLREITAMGGLSKLRQLRFLVLDVRYGLLPP